MRLIAACLLMLWAGPALAQQEGDAAHGKELSLQHCARCHVIGDYNRYGGINSTPSFQLLAKRDDWLERFSTFHARRPHPVFTRIEGIEPAYTGVEYVQPFTITLEEVEDIIAFVRAELGPAE